MRVIFGLVLLAGLALAGGAVYMAKNYISGYQQALAKERAAREQMVKTVPVYVAERTLAYGEPLTLEDVREVFWPENAIPEGVFASVEELFPRGEEVPRVVLRAMEKDEAILSIKVTEPGEDAGITSRLERGMRAFALNVDVSSGVSGFLRPGDRVDVYWTGKVNSGPSNQQRTDVTKLIEAGVKLIAVDQNATSDLSSTIVARTVTVSASPQQVASLAQAQSTGRLSLSLVGSGDDVVAEAIEVDQYRLLGLTREVEQVVEKKEVKKVCYARERRGAEVVITDRVISCPEEG
jgi:pilus assembly protein CpaB